MLRCLKVFWRGQSEGLVVSNKHKHKSVCGVALDIYTFMIIGRVKRNQQYSSEPVVTRDKIHAC